MSEKQPYPDLLPKLVAALVEGKISEQDKSVLSEILESNVQARQYYYDYLDIHVLLEWEHGSLSQIDMGENDLHLDTSFDAGKTIHSRQRAMNKGPWLKGMNLRLIGLAAFIVVAIPLVITILHSIKIAPTKKVVTQVQVDVGAIVSASVDAKIELEGDSRWVMEIGKSFKPCTLLLNQGSVDLQFNSGAVVRGKAPCRIEIINEMQVRLHRGLVTAQVPDTAHGFIIRGPILDVVDLGTQFGMSVGDDGKTEVHVFEGEVKLYHPEAEDSENGKTLKEGASVKVASVDDEWVIAKAESEKYIELLDKSRDQLIWQDYSAKLRRDQDMVFYYTFENLQSGYPSIPSVAKHSVVKSAKWENGRIIAGRFPNKSAIHFSEKNELLQMDVPGVYGQFTLSAWLKLDDLKTAGSLLMSNGHGEDGRDLRWHYKQNGDLKITITQRDAQGEIVAFRYFALGSIKEFYVDRWIHVAVTYDMKNREVIHYLNGKKLAIKQMPDNAKPISIGACRIGSWNSHGFQSDPRKYKGALGEMLMLKRVMGENEILKMFKFTNPAASKY